MPDEKKFKKSSQEDQDLSQYDEWIGTKAEKRERKKALKMSVHSAGLYDVWKIKTEKSQKNNRKE